MGRSATGSRAAAERRTRTPAQWYCLLVGLVLLAVGILGFISDSSFDTGNAVQGGRFLGFEVNGIHNLVHVASGLLLLAASPKRASARAVALAFGLVYGLVAAIGLVDGEDVLGVLPVNGADNVLQVALAALGIATSLISRGDDRRKGALERATDDRRFGRHEPAGAPTARPTGRR
jgi:hypothetical protein